MPGLVYKIDTEADLQAFQQYGQALQKQIADTKAAGGSAAEYEKELEGVANAYTNLVSKVAAPTAEQQGLKKYFDGVYQQLTQIKELQSQVDEAAKAMPAITSGADSAGIEKATAAKKAYNIQTEEQFKAVQKLQGALKEELDAFEEENKSTDLSAEEHKKLAEDIQNVKGFLDGVTASLNHTTLAHLKHQKALEAVSDAVKEMSSAEREEAQAAKDAEEAERAKADESIRQQTTLSEGTKKMAEYIGATGKTEEETRKMAREMFHLRAAIAPLGETLMPGLTHVILGQMMYGFSAMISVVLIASNAFRTLTDEYKEFQKYLESMPDWSKRFTDAAESQKQAVLDQANALKAWYRELDEIENKIQSVSDRYKDMEEARSDQEKNRDTQLDAKKNLEIAKAKAGISDEIQLSEALFAIEQRYADLKQKENADEARHKLEMLQNELFESTQAENIYRDRMTQASENLGVKSGNVEKLKAVVTDTQTTQDTATKAINDADEHLKSIHFAAQDVGVNHDALIESIREYAEQHGTGSAAQETFSAEHLGGVSASQYYDVATTLQNQATNQDIYNRTRPAELEKLKQRLADAEDEKTQATEEANKWKGKADDEATNRQVLEAQMPAKVAQIQADYQAQARVTATEQVTKYYDLFDKTKNPAFLQTAETQEKNLPNFTAPPLYPQSGAPTGQPAAIESGGVQFADAFLKELQTASLTQFVDWAKNRGFDYSHLDITEQQKMLNKAIGDAIVALANAIRIQVPGTTMTTAGIASVIATGAPTGQVISQAASTVPKYDSGGFTGGTRKHAPAGIVHEGEYVLSQEDLANIEAGHLEKVPLFRHFKSYAEGGGPAVIHMAPDEEIPSDSEGAVHDVPPEKPLTAAEHERWWRANHPEFKTTEEAAAKTAGTAAEETAEYKGGFPVLGKPVRAMWSALKKPLGKTASEAGETAEDGLKSFKGLKDLPKELEEFFKGIKNVPAAEGKNAVAKAAELFNEFGNFLKGEKVTSIINSVAPVAEKLVRIANVMQVANAMREAKNAQTGEQAGDAIADATIGGIGFVPGGQAASIPLTGLRYLTSETRDRYQALVDSRHEQQGTDALTEQMERFREKRLARPIPTKDVPEYSGHLSHDEVHRRLAEDNARLEHVGVRPTRQDTGQHAALTREVADSAKQTNELLTEYLTAQAKHAGNTASLLQALIAQQKIQADQIAQMHHYSTDGRP